MTKSASVRALCVPPCDRSVHSRIGNTLHQQVSLLNRRIFLKRRDAEGTEEEEKMLMAQESSGALTRRANWIDFGGRSPYRGARKADYQ